MKRTRTLAHALAFVAGAGVAALAVSGAAMAQDTVKIGVINAYSGQFTDPAAQLDAGIKLYMQLHGDTVAGKKIEIVRRDTGGIALDQAWSTWMSPATAS